MRDRGPHPTDRRRAEPQVVLSAPSVMTCDLAVAMSKWVREHVQPAARELLGSPVIRVDIMSAYSCRNAYGRSKSKLSEHGRANALDIRAFMLASGHTVDLLADWGPTKRDIIAAAAAARAAAEKKAAEDARALAARQPAA
ncbi:MAG TPA: extensin family protein, partial [Hyphomicrobiaceae bacterium]|nr:extensin family protein [Hyphomicrobiaceae bacterium]